MPGKWYQLRTVFDPKTDDEMEIALKGGMASLRAWAQDYMEGNDASDTKKYHSALVYYLNTYRPRLQDKLDTQAEALAAAWPNNLQELAELFIHPTIWNNALKRRFRSALCRRMVKSGSGTPRDPWIGADANEWADMMWPVIRKILTDMASASSTGLFPVDAPEKVAFNQLHLPTQIWYKTWKDASLPKRDRDLGIGIPRINPTTGKPVMGQVVETRDPVTNKRIYGPEDPLTGKKKRVTIVNPLKPKLFPVQEEIRRELRTRARKLRETLRKALRPKPVTLPRRLAG